MKRRMRDIDTEEEMFEAFKVFNRSGNGYISKVELKFVMEKIGENLSEKEID